MRRSLFLAVALICLTYTGVAYAGTMYAIDDATNALYTIDATTYARTFVGNLGVGGDFGDLAYDPIHQTAYWAPGRGNDNLYSVNLNTGAATLIGSHGVDDLFALAYDAGTGMLYGDSGNGNFYSINTTTGAATFIANNGVYPGGLTYRADTNQLILAGAGDGSFYSVNPTTGAVTFLGNPGFLNDNGVTFNPDKGVYFVDDWNGNLYTIDPNTYQATVVNNYGDPFDGLIWVGNVATPEPGTLALLGAGLVGVLVSLRRKR